MKSLEKLSFGILVSLSLQFFLGMVTNMFGAVPEDPKFVTESPLIKFSFILHGLNGLILPVFALSIFLIARKGSNQVIKRLTLYGFISVLVAAFAGISTITLKDNASELASLTMAVAFLFAFFFYVRFYFLIRK